MGLVCGWDGVFTSGGSQKGGAGLEWVAVVVTLAGDTYTGKANGVTVFTLEGECGRNVYVYAKWVNWTMRMRRIRMM